MYVIWDIIAPLDSSLATQRLLDFDGRVMGDSDQVDIDAEGGGEHGSSSD